MDSYIKRVHRFHNVFCPHLNVSEPAVPSFAIGLHRTQCLVEETAELAHAMGKQDKAKILDALVDLQYFLSGTVLVCGMQHVFEEAFDRVHQANMAKTDSRGRPVLDASGRVLKPKDWVAPVLDDLVEEWP